MRSTIRMFILLTAVAAMAWTARAATAAGILGCGSHGQCEQSCGDPCAEAACYEPACNYCPTCEKVCETKKVTVICWGYKCKDVCLPRCLTCCGPCTCGPEATMAKIRTVKVLMMKEVEIEVPTVKWKVPECAPAEPAEPAAEQPEEAPAEKAALGVPPTLNSVSQNQAPAPRTFTIQPASFEK